MPVLYQDSDILVIVKPAGILSERAEDKAGKSVADMFPELRIFTVHRLDRETAGIMVYALNKESAAALSEQIRGGEFSKKYFAVLRGRPGNDSGILEDWLKRDARKNMSFVCAEGGEGAKQARLEYRVLSENQGLCLADIALHTGRTHQIRVQFASRSCPVYGDGRYGGGSGELALFAYSLAFAHPATGEKMSFTERPDPERFPWNLFETEDYSL